MQTGMVVLGAVLGAPVARCAVGLAGSGSGAGVGVGAGAGAGARDMQRRAGDAVGASVSAICSGFGCVGASSVMAA
jgi:hypothetical protein